MKKLTIQEINHELMQFTGSEENYPVILGVYMTDGVLRLTQMAECEWLVTDISAVAKTKLKDEPFLSIKLVVTDSKGLLLIDDGNGNLLHKQEYAYTDFPEGIVRLYYCNEVLMLPNEY